MQPPSTSTSALASGPYTAVVGNPLPHARNGTPTSDDQIAGDLRRVLAIQALRAFLYGFASVLLGVTLASTGLSDAQVGLVFTAILIGMAVTSALVGFGAHRLGWRRAYGLLLLVMGCAGAVFAVTANPIALIIAALTGTLSTDPNESGPITSLEQGMIGQAPAGVRLKVFGRYNAIAYLAGALGALSAGLPSLLRRAGLPLPADRWFFLIFPVVAIPCAILATRLSDAVETQPVAGNVTRSALKSSRRTVVKLSALFSMDSFAGGFVVQAFVVFWFGRRFGASTDTMALVFFVSGLLQAGSSIIAARVGERFGLLNTMVFTHLPSNLLLILVPFAPTLGSAIAVWWARVALSQMDVPARQAYVVAMVDPDERVAAAAFTNTARYVSRPIGPALSGALMQAVSIGSPFIVAGAIKSMYDTAIYFTFRRVRLPDSDEN
jgi:predicted MFS family arabinose efflux permease